MRSPAVHTQVLREEVGSEIDSIPCLREVCLQTWDFAPPLFEKESHLGFDTLIANIKNPFWIDWPRTWTAFSSGNYPVDAFKIEFAHGRYERFDGKKSNTCICILEMHEARHSPAVLNGNAKPHMNGCFCASISFIDKFLHQRTAFCQHLIYMPIGSFHCSEHLRDVIFRHFFVKEVAHRIHKDHPRSLPVKRLKQPFGPQASLKTILDR